jgi:hypothetical protein
VSSVATTKNNNKMNVTMMYFYVVCFCFVVFFIGDSQQQRSTTIANANMSIDMAVPKYRVLANRYWFGPNGVVDFMDLVNAAQARAAFNTSLLFPNGTDAQQVYTLMSGGCDINAGGAAYYFTNGTASQAFICCHLSKLNNPGINLFMVDLDAYFMGAPSGESFQARVVDQIYNVQRLREVEVEGIQVTVCKDDVRINNAELEILRAELIGKTLGIVLRLYQYINARAVSLYGCINQITAATGCANNVGPKLGIDVVLDFNFLAFDSFFQSVCSTQALTAFELFRTSATC